MLVSAMKVDMYFMEFTITRFIVAVRRDAILSGEIESTFDDKWLSCRMYKLCWRGIHDLLY